MIQVLIDNSHLCPICGGYSARIPRRGIDHFRSLFSPVYRYNCQNYQCQWQGNIRKSQLKKYNNHLFS